MVATIVLVHGAWHGAWCWSKVVAGLEADGISTIAVDLPGHGDSPEPLGDLYGDAAAVRAVLDGVPGSVVLCGHSYGGAVITHAAAGHHAVQRLVYLAALALDVGESCSAAAPGAVTTDNANEIVAAMRFHDDGTLTLDPALAPPALYGDCTADDIADALARLGPQLAITFTQPVTHAAWRDTPSTYVVCADDRAIHPALQRELADRMQESVEWRTSHSPFLSRPDLVVGLLRGLAAETA